MKRKRLFSALMALAMLMSLNVSALANNIAALGAGTDTSGYLEVGTLGNVSWTSGDPLTVPEDFAEATIAYSATASGGAAPVTLGATTISGGWSVAIKSGDTLDLLKPGSAVIEFTNSGDTLSLTVKPDVAAVEAFLAAGSPTISGTIKLGKAGEFRPAVAANSDGQLNIYAKSSVSGDVTNEGSLPPDVINVKVPTAAQTKDAFDLYLDPHDLIATTQAQRYGSNISVTSGGRLYFKTTSGGAISMASSSAPLTIVNKSNVKVSVDLSVEATKSGGAFTFKDKAADVDSATGAAIYLALKSGTKEEKVSDTATNGKNTAKIETSIDTGDWYDLKWHGPKDVGYYSYDMTSTASGAGDSYFKSISFNLTGKINDDDAWDAISSFGLSVIWDVKAYQPVAVAPDATVATPLSGAGSTLTLNMNWGTLTSAKAKADLMFGTTVKKTFTSSDGATVNYVDTSATPYMYNQLPTTASVIFYNSSPTENGAVTVSNLAIR